MRSKICSVVILLFGLLQFANGQTSEPFEDLFRGKLITIVKEQLDENQHSSISKLFEVGFEYEYFLKEAASFFMTNGYECNILSIDSTSHLGLDETTYVYFNFYYSSDFYENIKEPVIVYEGVSMIISAKSGIDELFMGGMETLYAKGELAKLLDQTTLWSAMKYQQAMKLYSEQKYSNFIEFSAKLGSNEYMPMELHYFRGVAYEKLGDTRRAQREYRNAAKGGVEGAQEAFDRLKK